MLLSASMSRCERFTTPMKPKFERVHALELERVWIRQHVTREIAVGPHDEARGMRILRGEERLERSFLSLTKGAKSVRQ